jgi:hypothetical protein
MYRTLSSCNGQHFIGAPKPRRPDLHLELGEQAATLTLEIEHIDRAMPPISPAQARSGKIML